jgi:predicted esterase
LLAFSQTCAPNYRYVFTHPQAIRGVVAVCGGVPGDWNQNPLYRPAPTQVLHIAAREDEWYSREKNLEFKRQLGERAAAVDFRFYDSTHKFPRQSLPHIRRWIMKHL